MSQRTTAPPVATARPVKTRRPMPSQQPPDMPLGDAGHRRQDIHRTMLIRHRAAVLKPGAGSHGGTEKKRT
jgi:hypothetical protein